MKRFRLLLTAMMLAAIVSMYISCAKETVASPIINSGVGHDTDNFDFRQPITFSNTTEGASFYYTTNGDAPSTTSTPATSITLPTNANNTYIVRVIAVKEGFIHSDIAEKTFTKARVAPPRALKKALFFSDLLTAKKNLSLKSIYMS